MVLDAALPRWQRREQHRIATGLPATELLRAVTELTWAEVRLFRLLMSVRFRLSRRFRVGEPVLGWFHDTGFTVLTESEHALTLGLIQPIRRRGAPLRITSVAKFREFAEPGHIKIAFAFWCEPQALVTETRVAATDHRSAHVFTAYWVLIRAFSGLIRREWLRAIRRRAASGGAS
jgi:hypothetical protein